MNENAPTAAPVVHATGHIDSAKYVKAHNDRPTITDTLLRAQFPHLAFTGTAQQTGLLGRNAAGDFEVFVRHPWWVPARQPDGSIQYGAGGVQTTEHSMYLLGRTYGKRAAIIAQEVVSAVAAGDHAPYSALLIGKEHEAVAHNAQSGAIEALGPAEQLEFQAGIHEDALPPYASLSEAFAARIAQIRQREAAHPGLLLMDTSAPLAGSPMDPGMQLNNGDGGAYIRPWSEHLKNHLILSDKRILVLLKAIARTYSFPGYRSLMDAHGFQALWPAVACQTSIGLPHIAQEDGTYTVPLELATATADIYNSHVGAVADMLMASSPFVFGIAPQPLRDYRMALRYLFDGALPGPFIGSVGQLKQRWEYGGTRGMLYTLDRLAFQTKRPGHEPHAMIYGSARVRVETKDMHMRLGRVENTIAGSSPSLLDEVAHDAFIYLLALAAFEAVAKGNIPQKYYGSAFPHVAQWRRRRQLTDAFNMHGAQHPAVGELLDDTVSLLTGMRPTYAPLVPMIDFVIGRIRNMQADAVADVQAYLRHPVGPISEVMRNMYDQGTMPLTIMKEVYEYQRTVAADIDPMAASGHFFEQLAAYTR